MDYEKNIIYPGNSFRYKANYSMRDDGLIISEYDSRGKEIFVQHMKFQAYRHYDHKGILRLEIVSHPPQIENTFSRYHYTIYDSAMER